MLTSNADNASGSTLVYPDFDIGAEVQAELREYQSADEREFVRPFLEAALADSVPGGRMYATMARHRDARRAAIDARDRV